MIRLNKSQIINMLENDNHNSMVESNAFCLKLVRALNNNFICDNSMTANGGINRGELVESCVKAILGLDTTKSQAGQVDLATLNIEIKYSTRQSYACSCQPKTKLVLLITPKQIALINKNQMILNAKGRVSPNYKGVAIESEIVDKIKKVLQVWHLAAWSGRAADRSNVGQKWYIKVL